MGLAGALVLVGKNLGTSELKNGFWGQSAVLSGAACYATAMVFSRKYLRGQSPVVQSTMVLLIADLLAWIGALSLERPIVIPVTFLGWFAILWLGLMGSFVAYLLFFYLINVWGPTRASLVTYIFPVVGLILGIVFMGEPIDRYLFLGSFLIIAGIGTVNLQSKKIVSLSRQ